MYSDTHLARGSEWQRQWYPCATINADWPGPNPSEFVFGSQAISTKDTKVPGCSEFRLPASVWLGRGNTNIWIIKKLRLEPVALVNKEGSEENVLIHVNRLSKYNSKWKERRGRYRPKAFATHSSFVWFLLHLSRQLNNMVIASLALLIPLNAWYMPTIFRLQHCLSPFISPSLQKW